ncbi:protein disulfide isomerase (PDI) protein [Boothiomyces sp. JEL0838]|nr:protein disulfide isomerase (PDI) protein [Boothiomyces sp. JEL0838]
MIVNLLLALTAVLASVVPANHKNFKDVVLAEPGVVFVMCGHCNAMKPDYYQAAAKLKGLVKLVNVDCDDKANQQLCGQYGVQGFPTLKIFPAGAKGMPQDYRGERTAKAIMDTVLPMIPNKHVAKIGQRHKKAVTLEEFKASNDKVDKVVLVTDKKTTPPLFKALSIEYLDRLAFGEVKSSNAELVAELGVETFPAILVFPKDGSNVIAYDGIVKQAQLVEFLDKYALPSKRKKTEKKKKDEKKKGEQKEKKVKYDPKIPEIKNQDDLKKLCLADKTCIISFLTHEPEYPESTKALDEHIAVIQAVKTKYYEKDLYNFVWVNAIETGSQLIRDFGVSDMYPSMLALNYPRKSYRVLKTAFDEPSISSFLDATSAGLGMTSFTLEPKLKKEKTECPQVVYTDDHDSEFSTYNLQSMKSDRKLGIYFKSKEMHDKTLELLAFNCPDKECTSVCGGGWNELRNHVKKAHDSLLWFYGLDELYDHCREAHEQCFLCQRSGIQHLYFQNYTSLVEHFNEEHFPCREQRCIDQKFVVFGSDLDLQGHMLQEHADSRSKAKGKAIQLDFNYAGSATTRQRDDEVRKSRQRSDRSDTRSTSTPAVNASDNFPAHGGQRRGFGAELTDTSNPTPAELSTPAPIELTPAQDNALADAGPELMSSLEKIFKSNDNFLAQFKILTASFKANTVSASAFLNEFVNLSIKNNPGIKKDLVMNEVHRAWQHLAETFPEEQPLQTSQKKSKKKGMSIEEFEAMKKSESKRTAMLRAWNDHKATMQQENDSVYVKPSNWAQPPAPKKKVIPQPRPTVNPVSPAPPTWQRPAQLSVESLTIATPNGPQRTAQSAKNPPSLANIVKSGMANPANEQFPSLPSSSRPVKSNNTRITAIITSSKSKSWAKK